MADDQEFPPEVVEAVRREMCASCQGGGVCEAPPCDCARDILRTLTALGYRRVGPDEVVVHERHADIALGLLDVPQSERGGCWHIEAEGVLRRLAAAPRPGGEAMTAAADLRALAARAADMEAGHDRRR